MKRLLALLMFSAGILLSQPAHCVIFKSDYTSLPFGIEKDNSRIYSIASFDVDKDMIEFSSFNMVGLFRFSSNKYSDKKIDHLQGRDFVSDLKLQQSLSKTSEAGKHFDQTLYRKNYLNNSLLKDLNGVINGKTDEQILVKVLSRSQLALESNIESINNI